MQVVELPWRESVDELLEQLAELGLDPGSPGTLRAFPGCRHWHITKPGSKGVLELTHWPEGKRLWFKIAENRSAAWIEELICNETFRTFRRLS